MVIKASFLKVFLIGANVLLLCVGLTVLILGIKMLWALSVLSLINVPFVQDAVKSVITGGAFILLCSLSGLLGACSESPWLLLGHLIFLGIIVVLEFSIGVTLMMVKNSVSAAVESSECNNVCSATFDAALLDYALPSAGLMMSVIFVEALMIYSSIRLYFFIKDRPRMTAESAQSDMELNVQMRNVAGHQAAFVTQPPTAYASQTEYTPPQPEMNNVFEGPVRRSQSNIEERPPDYHSLYHYNHHAPPPRYTTELQYGAEGTSTTSTQPKDTGDSSNPV